MNQVVRGPSCWLWLSLFTPRLATVASRLAWRSLLRTYFLQQWFNLSDPGMEEGSMSRLCCGALPEWIWVWPRRRTKRRSFASAICLSSAICAARCWTRWNLYLESKGIRISTGTS